MAYELHKARNDIANLRNDSAKAKADYEEELSRLRHSLEGRDQDFDAMRRLWDKDRDELRKLRGEMLKLQKEKEDLVYEIGSLKKDSMHTEQKQNDLAHDPAHLLQRLKSQCEEIEAHFTSLLWEPAQQEEMNILRTLAEYNKELRAKMDWAEELSTRQQVIRLLTLFRNHRGWEFAAMKSLIRILSKSSQAKSVMGDDFGNNSSVNEPLTRTGAAIRLRFWQQNKDDHPWTLCEDIYQTRCQSLIEAGNVAAHQPDVAADVGLFTQGFLTGEEDLKVFANMYGKDLDFCTRLIRRTPQFCTLLNAEAAVYLLPNWREERDGVGWDEWIRLCAKLWRDWKGLRLTVICGDEPVTHQLPDLEAELRSVREFSQHLVLEARYQDC